MHPFSMNEFQILTFIEPNPKLNKLNRISIFDSHFLAGSLFEKFGIRFRMDVPSIRCNDDMFYAFIEFNTEKMTVIHFEYDIDERWKSFECSRKEAQDENCFIVCRNKFGFEVSTKLEISFIEYGITIE